MPGASVLSPFYPITVPPQLFRADCLRPMRRRPSVPHAIPAFPLLAPRYAPSDTIGGAVSAGRPAACPTGRRTGRVCGLVVDAMRPCLCLVHACLGSLTAMPLSVSSPLLHSRMALSLARSHHACDTLSPRPSTRETGSRAGRVLARRCGDDDVRRIKKKRARFSFPVRLLRLYRLYKPW